MMNCLKRRKMETAIPDQSKDSEIEVVKKRIIRQASLTALTLVLTVVILFAMTSAWYSNVVQTSGLTFEAESWGFDGKITLGEGGILAAPGDEGIVDLTVENQSDSVSALSVNVSKDLMADEMQKRLYFYVDTHMNREDETVERVYVNQFEGYTYYVFDNSFLTLTESYSNAPVIKWEWVYDVLGYYVIGEPYEVTDNGETVQKMRIEEYLRPIQYDFDEATTKIVKDEEGNIQEIQLVTVDGKTTPEEFLEELSKTDGYPGEIDTEKDHAFGNYYRVGSIKNEAAGIDENGTEAATIEEDGYGVYAYLCSYSEIQQSINYDTNLGEQAYQLVNDETLSEQDKIDLQKKLQFPATLSLSAQKDDDTAITVSTASALQEAIAANTANIIQLNSDIYLGAEETILIPENMRVMLDLGGNTLTNQAGTAIMAQPGSSLTLTGGKLIQEDQSGVTDPATTYGVRSVGAEVVLNQMEIQDFQHGVYIGDNAENNELDSRVYIRNSTIDGETCAAFISGNGLLTEQKSRLIIEGSTLTSPNIVVSGNGDANGNGRWGTDIQILNSTLTGTKADENSQCGVGIYQPQMKSTLTIRESTVSGCNGIVLKGGTAKIHKSEIIANGVYEKPSVEGSGFTNTGDAVYIETSYGYEIQLYISGSSVLEHAASEGCKSLRVFDENADNVLIKITSGFFQEEQPEIYLDEDSKQEAGSMEGVTGFIITSSTEVIEDTEVTDSTDSTETMGDANGETT